MFWCQVDTKSLRSWRSVLSMRPSISKICDGSFQTWGVFLGLLAVRWIDEPTVTIGKLFPDVVIGTGMKLENKSTHFKYWFRKTILKDYHLDFFTCNLENWESLISQSLFRSMVCISQKFVFSMSKMLRFEADVGANWRLGRLEWGMSAGKYLNQRHHNYRLIKSTPPKAKGKIKSQQLQPSTWGSICWFWDTLFERVFKKQPFI